MKKKITFAFLIILFLIQLFVPVKMIWDKEIILSEGTEFKFKTAPVDPSDPFRGKYITLNFENNSIKVSEPNNFKRGEEVYVTIKSDNKGYAEIINISKTEPVETNFYFTAKVQGPSFNNEKIIFIDFPFNRFYMEESKAYDAELEYRESQSDLSSKTYALVNIKNGEAVLKDVIIDGVSIVEIVKKHQLDEN